MAEELGTIGQPHWRVDGIGKVTGRARYSADLNASGMLWGKVLLARRPHARIVSIDTSKAKVSPGVYAVLTADDLPAERLFGIVIKNQPVLAFDKVRYYGDAVAMVAARSQAAAELALEQIDVEYEDLPAVFDAEEAMKPTAPLVHEPSPPNRGDAAGKEDETVGAGDQSAQGGDEAAGSGNQATGGGDEATGSNAKATRSGSNVCIHHRIRKGEVSRGFAEAKLVLERTYTTPHIEHGYIEPEAILAELAEDGGVRVTGSIQNIFSTRKSLAAVLDLDFARVTVKHATLGGSFGGKDEVMTQMACRAALLARATGRPVKMVNTREQSMAESYKRHPYALHYKVGADANGRLTAIEARIVADAGAYASMSPFVTWRSAVQATGPYECPNVSTDVFAVYTNNCYTGAMRGFGSPQVNFAVESLMDELAQHLGCDPLELRMRNAFEEGSITSTGQRLEHDVSIKEVLRRAAESAGWSHKRRSQEAPNRSREDGKRAGIGLACSYRGVSLGAEGQDAVGAIVSVQSDGSVIVTVGLTEMGQGVQSALSLIAAEVLGIDTRRVKSFNVHTGRVPDSGPTVASRSTLMGGQATKKAAEAVRDVLFEVAARMLGAPTDNLGARRGRIFVQAKGRGGLASNRAYDQSGGRDRSAAFEEIVAAAYSAGKPLLGFGWHKAPTTSWDKTSGSGDAYFTYVYSANVAEVEVDTETGKVDVIRITAAHDVGKAISPAMVRNQIYGGIAMGVGFGTMERYAIDRGVPLGSNLDEYLIPTALDMPEVIPIIVENPDPAGPFGAKSIGEPATEIAAPAILNAIAHATGRRITELPADLETVLLGKPLRKPVSAAQDVSRDRRPRRRGPRMERDGDH